jgi:hypothetical protein
MPAVSSFDLDVTIYYFVVVVGEGCLRFMPVVFMAFNFINASTT